MSLNSIILFKYRNCDLFEIHLILFNIIISLDNKYHSLQIITECPRYVYSYK